MKNSTEDLSAVKLLILLFVGIPLGILVSLYSTLLVTKIVAWYNVPVHLTFKQWFGVDLVLTIMLMSLKSKGDGTLTSLFTALFGGAFAITIGFALYYITSTLI